jgi:hypothetical protein
MNYQSSEIKYIEPHAKKIYNDSLFQQNGIITNYYQFEDIVMVLYTIPTKKLKAVL